MTHTPNPYPSLDDAHYDEVINGRYMKSTFSGGDGGCLSFTVANGLIGFQDDKLPPTERKARTSRHIGKRHSYLLPRISAAISPPGE